jgi:dolichol-phosphate mannosyltransferase
MLACLTMARLYLMVQVPLTGDEAYYWQWSRHLAWGYYDHPPGIAWLIAFFNGVFGRTLFATRLAGPFCITLTTVFLYLLGRDASRSPRIGAIGASLFLLAPLPAIGGMAVVPDAPMMACWSACTWLLYRALFADDRRSWWIAAVCLGLGIMSKLMAFFLIPSLFIFLAASPSHRSWLRRPEPYLFVLLGLLVASPFLLWNAAHHFETFTYQATSRMKLPPSPRYFLDFLAYEAAAWSPMLFLISMWSLWTCFRRKDARLIFMGSFCACILLTFVAVSFRTRAGGHWPFPGYVSLMAAMALLYQPADARTYRLLFRIAVGFATLMTVAVYVLLANPDRVFNYVNQRTVETHGINKGQKVSSKDLAEIYGYEELGQRVLQVQSDMAKQHPAFVITDSYALSSIIAFYSGLDTHVAKGSVLGREYRRWDDFDIFLGQDAVYVDLAPLGSRPDIQAMLQEAFQRVEPEAPMQVYKDGQPVRSFYLIRCYGFRDNQFRPQGGVQ